MRYAFLLRFVEALGIRRFYAFMARSSGERMLPSLREAATAKGWSLAELEDRRASTRYFGNTNLGRILLYSPILYLAWTGDVLIVFSLFFLFCVLHLVCAILEVYKGTLSYYVPVDEAPREKQPDSDVVDLVEYFFSPKPWETEVFYTKIGVEFFRWLVTSYIESIQLSKIKRDSGETIHYVESSKPQDLLKFEASTRVAESIHWVGSIFDVLPLGMVIAAGKWWWVPYFTWLLWGDTFCALLQRYHRVRVWELVVRIRERRVRQKARAQSRAEP